MELNRESHIDIALGRIAALRVPKGEEGALGVVFALLDAEASTIRVENPDEKTEDLKRFAEAFIDVLQRI